MSILSSTKSGTRCIPITEDMLMARGYSEYKYTIGYFRDTTVYKKLFVSKFKPFLEINYIPLDDVFWTDSFNEGRIEIKSYQQLIDLETRCKKTKIINYEYSYVNSRRR